MKTLTCGTLLVLLFAVATAAYAVPSMDVTVSDLQAKTARKISTKPDGTFAINGLRPGQYLVQFKARHALATNDRYLLILCAGEKTLISNAFPGKKLTAGGVAARMDVGAQKTLTG
ncbi:MAG: carboxypeptidase-like regulatory domain-containing protein, partial [Chthoniobacterales bacterium]